MTELIRYSAELFGDSKGYTSPLKDITMMDAHGNYKYGGKSFSPDETCIGDDGDLKGSPVGILRDLCIKMKLPKPSYHVRL